jgi:hypothetical protein
VSPEQVCPCHWRGVARAQFMCQQSWRCAVHTASAHRQHNYASVGRLRKRRRTIWVLPSTSLTPKSSSSASHAVLLWALVAAQGHLSLRPRSQYPQSLLPTTISPPSYILPPPPSSFSVQTAIDTLRPRHYPPSACGLSSSADRIPAQTCLLTILLPSSTSRGSISSKPARLTVASS